MWRPQTRLASCRSLFCPGLLPASNIHHDRRRGRLHSEASGDCMPEPLLGLSPQTPCRMRYGAQRPEEASSRGQRSRQVRIQDFPWLPMAKLMSIAENCTYSGTTNHQAGSSTLLPSRRRWLVTPNSDGVTGKNQPEMTFCSDR